MPHRIRTDGARLLDCNPRSRCGYRLSMCGYGFALWRAGELPGGFGNGTSIPSNLVKRGGPDRSGPGTSG